MPGPRPLAAGLFLLRLGGSDCGFLSSYEGGALTADVVTQPGPGYFDEKQLGATRPEELVLRAGLGLDAPFYSWLAETWTGKAPRQRGSVVAVDATFKARWRREFTNALVTGVTVPALDAAGTKAPGELVVRIAPETVALREGSGTVGAQPAKKQKQWTTSNFRLELDGLDCSKVSKIGAFTVTQNPADGETGERPRRTKYPTKLEFPNLRVLLAEASAQTWLDWFDEFVVKGINDSSTEKEGRIVFLAPDLKSALGEVRLFGVGIFRLDREPQAAGTETVARLRADLYCERMELEVG